VAAQMRAQGPGWITGGGRLCEGSDQLRRAWCSGPCRAPPRECRPRGRWALRSVWRFRRFAV